MDKITNLAVIVCYTYFVNYWLYIILPTMVATSILPQKILSLFTLIAVIGAFVVSTPINSAQAAPFTEASIRLDRMKVSVVDNDILVVVKPASTATEAKVRVEFSGGFGVDATATNITTSTAGLPATYQGESVTAWPTIGATATTVAGNDVTFSSGDLTVGTLYAFYITNGIDNPGSAGSDLVQTISTLTSGDAIIDSTDVAVAVVTDDQVVITATVPPTFSFALSSNADAFTSNLNTTSIVSTSGVTATVATNAANGWIAWLKSANQSLDSATTGETIDSQGTVDNTCTSLVNGSNYYQLDVDLTTDSGTGDGTVTVAPEYNCATTSGGTFSATYQEIATASGTTDGDVITMLARSTISAVTAAATDYTDTWTVIGAGNF